jgi:methionyl-tRNA formyltransferase
VNILYIGSAGALSLIPFRHLLSADVCVSAVGVANPIVLQNKIIALENESLSLAASASGIPVIDLSRPVAEVVAQCEKLSIDIILMSCYRKRLPTELIKLASNGCYNMHPSLLPDFRGPEPIFWQMKSASDVGVSWHCVVDEFDAGDIVCQQKVQLDDGASYQQINSQLAETGARLLSVLLSDLSRDTLTSTPQGVDAASYYHYPEKQDFTIDVNQSAQQIYNFMCATQAFSRSFVCNLGAQQYYLEKAVDFDNNRALDCAEVQGERLFIPCNQGVLIAIYTDKIPVRP